MDDEKYERDRCTYHYAKSTAMLASAITAFITFCAFMIFGFPIEGTVVWMFGLSMMAGSALFVVMFITTSASLKRQRRTPSA